MKKAIYLFSLTIQLYQRFTISRHTKVGMVALKINLVDVGLLRRLAQLASTTLKEGNRLFTEFKVALIANYVLQTLITQYEVEPHYLSRSNPPYEVDFLIQCDNDIFPVEVKY